MVGRVVVTVGMPMMMPVMIQMITRPTMQYGMFRLCHHGARPARRRIGHGGNDQRQKRQHRRYPHQDRTDPAHRPTNTRASTVQRIFRK